MAFCSAVMVFGRLVVVGDFNFMRISRIPAETDAPLIVDADAVLPGSITLERFEAIAGWYAQCIEAGSRIENVELIDRALKQHGGKARAPALPELFRLLVAEINDHSDMLVA